MSGFVHLAPERLARKMRYGGIKTARVFLRNADVRRGVYAFPVLPNYTLSHQWLRELKRGGARTIVGVYFRLPDDEPVVLGHYGRGHIWVTASVAAGFLRRMTGRDKDMRGYEIIIPRKIQPKEIRKVRALPQKLGWRYWPEAHGHRPCGCPVCWERGSIRSRRIRDEWLAGEAELEGQLEG